jgi:serine/threonine protein kinase
VKTRPPTSKLTSTLIGATIGDSYEIISLLGKGGMASVFLANHLRLPGKQVAIKVLAVEGATKSPEFSSRFRREAEIACRLTHPNIVAVTDYNQLPDGTPYLVMEYLQGESLRRRLSRGPLELDLALSIARQIGSALFAAHRAGVVHRDLKPDNIFLVPTESGGVVSEHVKVLDFGISKLIGPDALLTQEDVLVGTPTYMAPEQAQGRNSEISERTDIWALGAIVYEMLAGGPAFEGDSIVTLLYKIVHEPVVPLDEIVAALPERVGQAVARAMAKDPTDRHRHVKSFVEALTGQEMQTLSSHRTALVEIEPSSGTETKTPVPSRASAVARTRAGASTNRGWILWAAAGLAGTLGVSALLLQLWPSPSPGSPDASAAGPPPVLAAAGAEPGQSPKVAPPRAATMVPVDSAGQLPAPDAGVVDRAPAALTNQGSVEPALAEALGVAEDDGDTRGLRGGRRTRSDDLIPGPVVLLLEQAFVQLRAKDSEGAMSKARQSLQIKETPRAYALMTMAACLQGDQASAKRYVGRARTGVQQRLRKFCAAHHVDLQGPGR